MKEVFSSPLFGIFLSILAFWAGEKLQKKTGLTACSPLLTAIVLIIGVLLLFDIPMSPTTKAGRSSTCSWRRPQPVWLYPSTQGSGF